MIGMRVCQRECEIGFRAFEVLVVHEGAEVGDHKGEVCGGLSRLEGVRGSGGGEGESWDGEEGEEGREMHFGVFDRMIEERSGSMVCYRIIVWKKWEAEFGARTWIQIKYAAHALAPSTLLETEVLPFRPKSQSQDSSSVSFILMSGTAAWIEAGQARPICVVLRGRSKLTSFTVQVG